MFPGLDVYWTDPASCTTSHNGGYTVGCRWSVWCRSIDRDLSQVWPEKKSFFAPPCRELNPGFLVKGWGGKRRVCVWEGWTHVTHGRSRTTFDPRIPKMPGRRSTSGFFTDQSEIACTKCKAPWSCSASLMKGGDLHGKRVSWLKPRDSTNQQATHPRSGDFSKSFFLNNRERVKPPLFKATIFSLCAPWSEL